MTVPCENVLAAFPASHRAGNVSVGPMTIGSAILLGAFDVPLELAVPVPEEKLAIAAMLLSPEWRDTDTLPDEIDFRRFAKRLKATGKDLASAVDAARASAFATYVKPPPPPAGARKRTTPHGCGWPLELAEYLCGEYGWSWREALATPVATAFALSAASRQRHGAPPGGLDYIERISQDAVKAKKRIHQT